MLQLSHYYYFWCRTKLSWPVSSKYTIWDTILTKMILKMREIAYWKERLQMYRPKSAAICCGYLSPNNAWYAEQRWLSSQPDQYIRHGFKRIIRTVDGLVHDGFHIAADNVSSNSSNFTIALIKKSTKNYHPLFNSINKSNTLRKKKAFIF